MFRRTVLSLALASLAGLTLATSASAGWNAWGANGGTGTVATSGTITLKANTSVSDGWAADGDQLGQKAFYSTSDYNGMKVGDLFSFTLTDQNGGPVYSNIFVTDGTNKGILAAGFGKCSELTWNLWEATGSDGLLASSKNGAVVNWADYKDLSVCSGGWEIAPIGGWPSLCSTDGVRVVIGNRSGSQPGEVSFSNACVKVVPEPMFFQMGSLLALGGLGLLKGRKR